MSQMAQFHQQPPKALRHRTPTIAASSRQASDRNFRWYKASPRGSQIVFPEEPAIAKQLGERKFFSERRRYVLRKPMMLQIELHDSIKMSLGVGFLGCDGAWRKMKSVQVLGRELVVNALVRTLEGRPERLDSIRVHLSANVLHDAVRLPFELKKERDLPEHGNGHLVFPNRCTGHGAMCWTWLRGKPG